MEKFFLFHVFMGLNKFSFLILAMKSSSAFRVRLDEYHIIAKHNMRLHL